MTTLRQMLDAKRQPLVVRWELVTDEDGRTRPRMRWEPSTPTASRTHAGPGITLAA